MIELDTIAAVSTPRGRGGVALIRISGDRAVELAEKVFRPAGAKTLRDVEARRQVYGRIYAPDAKGHTEMIDDGMATVFYAPASFTGEDTVEICCHGGALVTETVLSACLAAGCRAALPGEFTRRAFVSGKIGLSQAESLGALLEAKTYDQLLLSRNGLDGGLGTKVRAVYEAMRSVMASMYAKIDFPDEDLSSMTAEEIANILNASKIELEKLASTYKTGRAVAEGIKTVICGRTNAGKSSLYNKIVGREAAIVTDIEGTTRDIIEETVAFGGITLRLCDTAGLRQTDDRVESIGIDRANAALSEAELVLAVIDSTRPLDADELESLKKISTLPCCKIAVLNKCDASELCGDTLERARQMFEHTVQISALSGAGMDGLSNLVSSLFREGDIDLRHDAVVTGARQYSSILRGIEGLENSLSALCAGLPFDLCSSDIELAMSALSELDGRQVDEDIVSEIFSHFCVGK